jgi:hypothetical protein
MNNNSSLNKLPNADLPDRACAALEPIVDRFVLHLPIQSEIVAIV